MATREITLRQLAEDFDEAIRPIIRANLATTPSQSLLDDLVSEAMKWEPELAASLIQDHWRQDYRPALEHVAVPTLIIGGGRSAFTPVAALQYMHERIQGSALSIIENSGHAPFAEHPQRFNQEVRRFLDRVD